MLVTEFSANRKDAHTRMWGKIDYSVHAMNLRLAQKKNDVRVAQGELGKSISGSNRVSQEWRLQANSTNSHSVNETQGWKEK